MAYNPEATVARPLLSLTSSPSYQPHSPRCTSCLRPPYPRLSIPSPLPSRLLVGLTLGGATTAYVRPDLARAAVPEQLALYYHGSSWGRGNALPPAHDSPDNADTLQLTTLRASQHTLPAARAQYSLQTGRMLLRVRRVLRVREGAGVFVGRGEGGLGLKRSRSEGNAGRFCTHVRTVAQQLAAATDKRGMTALQIHGGKVVRPEYEGTYWDGDWEVTVNKFAPTLPDLTVLINGCDKPHIVFDVKPLLAASSGRLTVPSLV
ncbi:hypothetical protein B0H11DRAFT_2369442 [Mycena galericulata]|nr:hypothetical protein B0H11DRAFT_2369442 [Mycena galericulata]